MNSNLYDDVWDFPEEMRNHMKICFAKVKNADANTEGFNRNRRLQTIKSIGYPELKRIKNFFDTYQGKNVDAPFILNGENKMKNFVESILSGARQSLSTTKQIKNQTGAIDKDYVEVPNANINLNLSRDDSHKKTSSKYNAKVNESLERINELIKKII
jgi:hypothetical protein